MLQSRHSPGSTTPASGSSRPDRAVPGAGVRPSAADRRRLILALLTSRDGPHRGDALADQFAVSRQAIVHDIALLRAEGAPILATVRGYLLPQASSQRPHRTVVTVRHRPEEAEDELLALVDAGVRVVDVIVEHPVYGELRGDLHLSSPAEVRDWAASARRTGVKFLSELTDGVHLHTLEAGTTTALDRARANLAERGYLLRIGEDEA